MKTAPIPKIIAQHSEEAAFLWLTRDSATGEPHYSLKDLAKLDGRVEAHLDGLRVAGDYGWEVVRADLAWREPGEFFAASRVALDRSDRAGFDQVLAAACGRVDSEPGGLRAIVSALGWGGWNQVSATVEGLLKSEDPERLYVGVAAAAVHRSLGMDTAERLLRDSPPKVRARVHRACGEMMFSRLLARLEPDDRDVDSTFWACWSGTLMGDGTSLRRLMGFCRPDSPYADRAVGLVARYLSVEDALGWQKELASRPESMRLAILAAGAIGAPELIDSLFAPLEIAALARVAGEAITTISGADLAYEDLEGAAPDGFEGGPSEDPGDGNISTDADAGLPWPDPSLLLSWWESRRGNFAKGVRYLCGEPIRVDSLWAVLSKGRQRQRRAAALEMARLATDRGPLFEWRARGDRQRALLDRLEPKPGGLNSR